jgi:hypothetical protein
VPDDRNEWSDKRSSSTSELVPLVVTNLIKLGGLVVVLHEAFRPEIRPGALGIAALMMAGAIPIETFLRSFFGGGKS